MRDGHALALALAEVAASNIANVAIIIGVSRTTLSLYLADKYPANSARVERAILACFDRFICPYINQEISGPDCQLRANQPRPFGGRAKSAHWEACRTCLHHRPSKEKQL